MEAVIVLLLVFAALYFSARHIKKSLSGSCGCSSCGEKCRGDGKCGEAGHGK